MKKVYHIVNSKFYWILSFVFCILSFLVLCRVFLLGYYPDFNTQYYVPQMLFNNIDPYSGGSTLYTPQVYPPTTSLIYIPFSIMPLKIASYVFTAFSVGCLLVSLLLLTKIYSIRFFSSLNFSLMGLVFIFFPVKFSLGMGQINLLVLSLLVYSIWLLGKKKDLLSGVVIGLSLVIKMFPMLLPIYFLLKLQKKLIFGILITIVISSLFVVFFIPQDVIYKFFSILPTFVTSWKLDYYNQALSGFVGRSFGVSSFASNIKVVLTCVICGIVLFSILKNKANDIYTISLKIGLLIGTNVVINTFSWQHHFVWMLIPLYTTFFYIRKNKLNFNYLVVLSISYLLIAINFESPLNLPILFQSHVFFGGLLLLIIDCLILQKASGQLAKH